MAIKNKKLAATLVAGVIVVNVIPSQVLAKNNNTYSESDRQSRETYEPYSKKLSKKIEKSISKEIDTLTVSDKLLSMTEKETIKVEATFDYEVNKEDIKFTFGGKDLDQFKTWDSSTKDYTGAPFIKVENLDVIVEDNDGKKTSIVIADINTEFVYGTTDLSNRTIRVKYPEMIGNYDLKIEDTTNNTSFKSTMKLNVYDSYRTYDEIKPELDSIFEKANQDIYLSYESIGKSVENRDLHFVVMAKDQESVNQYLNKTVPMMLEEPEELQKQIKNKTFGDYKVPIFINNIHADEAPGVDAQLDLLKKLTTEDVITYKTLDENKQEVEVKLNVEELLENVIFVMSITENPDGRYYNTRPNANGFDLNRDNGYQTQVETLSIVEQIAKWNPISFLDLHGFVKGLLIEPCTPPHDPNYEYDLIAENATGQAHAMGKSAIANTKYDKYEIPLEDYGVNGGWDDATAAYTGTYALHHGAMSHTIEIPELNQDSVNALTNAILGASSFILDNKDDLFLGQLEYYRRGVAGEDNRAADKYFVNAKGESIGRPRGDNENFFPEYYVLPIDEKLQKNSAEVHETVDYLLRNGVKVDVLQEDTKVGDKLYQKGSYVVDMHQAKRGYANLVLYDGINASDFKEMYAEIVMNFPDTRGFNEYEVRTKDAFKGKLSLITKSQNKQTVVDGNYDNYIIKNSSNDTIMAINELLANNNTVNILVEDSKTNEGGDFLVSAKDLKTVANKYSLEVKGHTESVKVKSISQPKVYTQDTYSKFVLEELGFKLVNVPQESTIIVDDSGKTNPQDIKNGIDYLGIGKSSIEKVGQVIVPGIKTQTTDSYHEGLLKGEYIDDIATSGYDQENYIYTASGTWIEEVPQGVKEISKVSDKDDYYVSGWWPGNEKVKGKTMGVTTDIKDTKVTLFANTLTNKAHPQGGYRLISNAVYSSVDGKVSEIKPDTTNPSPGPEPEYIKFKDIENHWAKYEIEKFVAKGYINGYGDNTFRPNKETTRAEFVKMINQVFGFTGTGSEDFKDVDSKDWFYNDICIGVNKGYINGYKDKTFKPNSPITREEASKIVASILASKGDGKIEFKDSNKISSWAKESVDALSDKGIIEGYEDKTFRPKNNVTRAEAVTILSRTKK